MTVLSEKTTAAIEAEGTTTSGPAGAALLEVRMAPRRDPPRGKYT